MNLLKNLVDHPFAANLAWALVHFVWQGALVALSLTAALRALKSHSANLRYVVACAALLLMLALPSSRILFGKSAPSITIIPNPITTTSTDTQQAPAHASAEVTVSASTELLPAVDGTGLLRPSPTLSSSLTRFASWMVLVWFSGVLLLSLRLVAGWIYIRRLQSRFIRTVDPEWSDRLWRLCRQMRLMQPVQLVESALVSVPTAIGCLKPMILLPASALSGLSVNQLEAILAHELAHIRRHDYLVNLFQSLIETLLFYHPAVWWVSRKIREEREACCDDLAVELCADKLVYARALLEMEELRVAQPRLAMAANGGLLMNRIQRLAQRPQADRFGGVVAGLLALALLASVGVTAQIAAPEHGLHVAIAVSSPLPEATSENRPIVRRHRSEKTPTLRATQQIIESASGGATPIEFVSLGSLMANPAPNPNPAPAPNNPSPVPDPTKSGQVTSSTGQGLESANATERAVAACAIGKAGSVEYISKLIDLLADDTTIEPINCWNGGNWSPALSSFRKGSPSEQAAIALASFGEASVQPLIAALERPNPAARSNAAWAIGELRGGLSVNRDAAIEPLIIALRDSHPWVRRAAAFALGEMRPGSATDALIGALSDGDENVRSMVASALGEMKSRRAVPQLSQTLLSDQNQGVRAKAAWALGEIADSSALDALNTALTDLSPSVRSSVRRAISEMRE